ncbi:sigma-70 family RNA polymerase sigma factor [Streptomyces sp. AC512_CC834]|uniref:BACON domain-containing protein n=1 Tax=Streptomyces sp. AC512_CC834 TaxID=2823691 RepID=UPI001C279002|nr:sigma-70 family RNA polymerase sigma factor [Streptomyces sp. AC512_CC834]
MRSSPETTTRTTGAHRAHREARDRTAARTLAQRPPARYAAYDAYLDGLFTYCLSVLCDHDAATAALGDVLALAERRGHRGPGSVADRRAWLYALARWACLRKLAEAKQKRPSTHAAGRPDTGGPRTAPTAPTTNDEAQQRHRRELALLAWPEAAGTTPEQREALELAVRHHLAPHEVAAVLGMDLANARELLASAACEVERTRAALAVVETGTCAGVARLTGDNRYVLSGALRRELVRHVDDCPRCRRTAERAIPGRWPGTSVTPAELPVLEAPRTALHVALTHTPRARGTAPRFDRRGFPMDPKDRAARRDRLRARAVTTTVVATVVAAPVLALWAAYRGTPVGEGEGGRSASASEAQDPDGLEGESAGGGYGYENAGNASTGPGPGTGFGEDGKADVSVEVVSVSGAGEKGAGHLEVTAGHDGDTTLVTLTATGDAPVRWSASTGASWLYLSQSSGTLRPGEALTIRVYVDQLREPSGRWSARVAVSPVGAAVSIEGYGTAPGPSHPGPRPGPPDDTSSPSHPDPDPDPSTSQPPDPTPTDDPPPTTSPDPDPTTTEPSPTGGTGGSSPPPSDTGDPSPSTS